MLTDKKREKIYENAIPLKPFIKPIATNLPNIGERKKALSFLQLVLNIPIANPLFKRLLYYIISKTLYSVKLKHKNTHTAVLRGKSFDLRGNQANDKMDIVVVWRKSRRNLFKKLPP